MRTYGLSELVEAVRGTHNPRYGAIEDARWNSHMVEVMARAFGSSLDALDLDRQSSWEYMNQLCVDRPKHPFSGMLESSLLERRFGDILAPVHEAHRRLIAAYEQELLRMGKLIFGEGAVSKADLLAHGLDEELTPNWPEIYDRL
jgi:hypothetical protein